MDNAILQCSDNVVGFVGSVAVVQSQATVGLDRPPSDHQHRLSKKIPPARHDTAALKSVVYEAMRIIRCYVSLQISVFKGASYKNGIQISHGAIYSAFTRFESLIVVFCKRINGILFLTLISVFYVIPSFASVITGKPALVYQCVGSGYVNTTYFRNLPYLLVIAPNPITTKGTYNGINPFDFIFIAGSLDTPKVTGTIWFATNTALDILVSGSSVYTNAAIDNVFMSQNSQNQFVANVDPRVSIPAELNGFAVGNGVLSRIYLIKSGYATMYVSSNIRTINATLSFKGTGYISLGNASYQSNMTCSFYKQTTFP